MKTIQRKRPSHTAYYREIERDLFVLDHGKEYGDNLIIAEEDENGSVYKNTVGAIKIMAFDELMAADPVTKLRNALEDLLHYPMDIKKQIEASHVLRSTRRFSEDWQ